MSISDRINSRLPERFTDRVALAVIVGCGALLLAGCSGPSRPPIVIPDHSPAITTPPASAPSKPEQAFGDGTHRVIDDVAAGTYRTPGSRVEDIPLCSWRLLKGERLIASGSATGPVSIVVEPVYTEVTSEGCLEWHRVGDAP